MRLRVLLVDDNREFLDAAMNLLEAEGFEVVGTATTAAGAITSARSLEPDIALVDIELGIDSGITLSKRLREQSPDGGPRVLLISAHAEEDFRELIEASPAVGFIAKSDLSAAAIMSALAEPST